MTMLEQRSDHCFNSFVDKEQHNHGKFHPFVQKQQHQLSLLPLASNSNDDSPASLSQKSMASSPKRATMAARYRKQRRKSSVQWGSAYTYVSSVNPEDFPAMWYNAKDLERFQREKRKVIKALKHVKGDLASLEGTKYVTRGFEGYQTIEFNRIVRKQRRAVVESVMSVQRQRKETKQQQLRQQQKLHEENNGGGKADHYYCVPHCVMEQDDLEDAVAHAARQESAWARELAHQMGLKDEETVRLGWQEFFAEVAVDGELSNSDSETSLSSLSVQDCPTSNIFDHMHFEHVTCVVENCTTFVA